MSNEFSQLEYAKSNLNFINCLREVLGLDPLHQGQEGSDHYSVRAKMIASQLTIQPEAQPENDYDDLAELQEIIHSANIHSNIGGVSIKKIKVNGVMKEKYITNR